MDYSTPGFLVHHQLPELAQTRDHGVSDAIQPSHPLSSPSPPFFNLSQDQGLYNIILNKKRQTEKIQNYDSIYTEFKNKHNLTTLDAYSGDKGTEKSTKS